MHTYLDSIVHTCKFTCHMIAVECYWREAWGFQIFNVNILLILPRVSYIHICSAILNDGSLERYLFRSLNCQELQDVPLILRLCRLQESTTCWLAIMKYKHLCVCVRSVMYLSCICNLWVCFVIPNDSGMCVRSPKMTFKRKFIIY